ncbi:MAG: PASTA domain-containing protein, partial [Terracidiphilus sp.]
MNRRNFVNFFQVGSLVMLLLAVAMFSAMITMHFAIHGAEVQVPQFKDMTVADARSQAAGLGLDMDVDNRYYSADVAAGHILSQSPAPGTVVRREWRVRVAESLGPQKADVPDTVGADQRTASLKLRRVGLDVGLTVELPWSHAPEGTVLAQDPPAHAQGIARPSINLLVAKPGDETADAFVMPDLTGLPLAAAQAALAHVGIHADAPKMVDAP